jgi:hypothetical protein
LHDIGLLSALSNIDISTFYINRNNIFSEYQGALAEQYVLQELKYYSDNPILYWGRDKGTAKVDFIIQFHYIWYQ